MTYPQDRGAVRKTGGSLSPFFPDCRLYVENTTFFRANRLQKTTHFPHFPSVKMTVEVWQGIRFSAGFPV